MPAGTQRLTEKKNILPEDIFSYNNDLFYECIKQAYGNDIAELFSFQVIRNAGLLLDTSCEDILLVLQQESDDIDTLKKMCCFEVAGNKYQVKLGVKLTINNLIQSLKLKQEQKQIKKRKRYSNQGLASNTNSVTPLNQAQTQDTLTPLESTLSSSLTTNISFIQSTSTPMQRKLDELGHTADIEERIDRRWVIHNDAERACLEQGIDYFLAINKSSINTYTCVLSCKCHARFKLPRFGKENNLVHGEISSSNQSKTLHSVATSSGIESQQVKKAAHTTTSKRIRPQSGRHGVIKKRVQNLTPNTMDILQLTELTDDMMNSSHDDFNDFIETALNNDLYDLFRLQSVRDMSSLSSITVDELTAVLSYDIVELSSIKRILGFVSTDGKFHLRIGFRVTLQRLISLIKSKTNSYDNLIQQFALLLFILGGRNCYEFLRLNLPAALPHISNVELLMRNNEQRILECEFRFQLIKEYYQSNNCNYVLSSEDATRCISRIDYVAQSNIFIGFSSYLVN
ncbi:unnamed protein product [Rotaria socialis]|uniref:Uncharacterized protein n=4 Tax=Rotaria socialis TaxID=392032 RepID=A0A818N886_9BILA|nr:unnamed protein product [Rotaria socialis]CAF4365204.1 unnamed protein product [Rotaria socialis]